MKQAAVAEMDRGFAILDAALEGQDWLAGDRLSVADIYLAMLVAWHPQVEKVPSLWPNIERRWDELRKHEVIRKLNASHAIWPA